MFEEVPITTITVGPRFRQDLGNIPALAASIEAVGLLHPIVITTTHALIVGRRRLAAYAHLGKTTIPALVIDLDHPLGAEFDENERRKNLNPSEKIAISEALYAHEQKKAKIRQREAGKKHGRGQIASEKFTEAIEPPPPVRDVAAAAVGWSGPTYAKAKKVVDAAREDAEFHTLVEEMDRTGNVSRAYNKLPAYLREDPAADITPKKPRIFGFERIMQRLDHTLQTVLVPSLALLDAPRRDNIRKLLQLYLSMLDHQEETDHVHSA
jgi:ParB/RepB/Spo0J family partition protein